MSVPFGTSCTSYRFVCQNHFSPSSFNITITTNGKNKPALVRDELPIVTSKCIATPDSNINASHTSIPPFQSNIVQYCVQ